MGRFTFGNKSPGNPRCSGCSSLPFTSVDGAVGRAYAITNRRIDYVEAETPLKSGFWRSVGNSHTAFVMEAFADELAAAGHDPLEFRYRMLAKKPRHAAVLELAAARAGWGEAPPPGRHRGIAFHESMGSTVAEVAEFSSHQARNCAFTGSPAPSIAA